MTKTEEIKTQIKSQLKNSASRIEKLSSEALATGISSGLLALTNKKDKENSEEVEKLFSHFASIHSYDQLGQEMKLLLADVKSSAPDLGKVMKEISGTRTLIVKKIMDRVGKPSVSPTESQPQ